MPFDVKKAAQAVAVILVEEAAESLDYIRVLKLLYIAERESIKEIARPIIGDRIVAMDNGPVMSRMYDLIKKTPIVADQLDEWLTYIEPVGRYALKIAQHPGVGRLSRYELAKLQEVTRRHLGVDVWTVVNATHELEEFKKHHVKGTSTLIPMKAIFDAVGAGEKYEPANLGMQEEQYLDEFFAVK
jgi:uncharacterized phage-associated protein